MSRSLRLSAAPLVLALVGAIGLAACTKTGGAETPRPGVSAPAAAQRCDFGKHSRDLDSALSAANEQALNTAIAAKAPTLLRIARDAGAGALGADAASVIGCRRQAARAALALIRVPANAAEASTLLGENARKGWALCESEIAAGRRPDERDCAFLAVSQRLEPSWTIAEATKAKSAGAADPTEATFKANADAAAAFALQVAQNWTTGLDGDLAKAPMGAGETAGVAKSLKMAAACRFSAAAQTIEGWAATGPALAARQAMAQANTTALTAAAKALGATDADMALGPRVAMTDMCVLAAAQASLK
jgi:hypothetical protein